MADPPQHRGSIQVITTDEQEFMTVDAQRWGDLVATVVSEERVEGAVEVGLGFVDEAAISALHQAHLGGAGPTDVLSFPLDDSVSVVPDGQVRLLGDIVVCPSVASRQAGESGHSVDHELAVLVVHGTLHLLGYDHAEPAEKAEMFARQAALVEAHSPS